MGRIVIETDPVSGHTTVDLTMDNGQRLKFAGVSDSELKHVDPEPDFIEIGTADGFSEKIPGLKERPHWQFNMTVDKIPRIEEIK